MQEAAVKRVVIAGGGTAGWTAAAALSQHLGELIDIVLIESEQIGIVGVGEATFPSVQAFHRMLEIDEREFMRATQATFKLGISFENWGRLGDSYMHAFGTLGRSTWMGDFQHLWFAAKEQGFGGDLGNYSFEAHAARAGKFAMSDKVQIHYAYHFDATLYAAFLRNKSEQAGVRRIAANIVEVGQNAESGDIRSLKLDNGDEVSGDLFIDCTGFAGLLIEKTLASGFEDWSHWLPMDTALATQTKSKPEVPPYTRAIAREAGWQWQIPLQHRVGNGWIFSSRFQSVEDARERFISELDDSPLFEPRLIRFTTGRRKHAWVKNCVSIGLSSGFLEPLESTSIHLIQIGVTRLMQLFPFNGMSPAVRDRYNEQSQLEFERIRDFLVLHYYLTERSDTSFWRQCRAMTIPETLASRIALFRESGIAFQGTDEMFRVDSWSQVMVGQRLMPDGYHHMGRMLGPERLRVALGTLQSSIARAVERMPAHKQFLAHYCEATADEAPPASGQAQVTAASVLASEPNA